MQEPLPLLANGAAIRDVDRGAGRIARSRTHIASTREVGAVASFRPIHCAITAEAPRAQALVKGAVLGASDSTFVASEWYLVQVTLLVGIDDAITAKPTRAIHVVDGAIGTTTNRAVVTKRCFNVAGLSRLYLAVTTVACALGVIEKALVTNESALVARLPK